MIFKSLGAENAAAKSVATGESLVAGTTCVDFESCRLEAERLSVMHFNVSHAMVHTYDPSNGDGFKSLVSFFSSLFADKQEAAAVFGVSVSTFYRWKAGETVPHALVRAAIRDTILRHLGADEAAPN